MSGAAVSEPLALDLPREKPASWRTPLALTCRSGHLDIQVDRSGSQTWKWEWRSQRFDTRCLPAIEKSLSPPMYMQFQGSGSMELDPALVGGFKGELQAVPIGLVFNRKFLLEGGDIHLGFQESRVLLKNPIILGTPFTEEPRFEKGDSGDYNPNPSFSTARFWCPDRLTMRRSGDSAGVSDFQPAHLMPPRVWSRTLRRRGSPILLLGLLT